MIRQLAKPKIVVSEKCMTFGPVLLSDDYRNILLLARGGQ